MTAPTTDAAEPVESADEPAVEAAKRSWVRSAIAADGSVAKPVWLVGPLAAVWAAFIGLAAIALVMVLVWALSVFDGMGISSAAQTAGLMWVVSHDVALRIGTATFSLLPWGLMLVWLALLVVGGRWAARSAHLESIRDGVILIGSSALVYGAILAGVSSICVTADARTSAVRAFGVGFVLAVIGVSWGALRGSALGAVVLTRLPGYVLVMLRGALAGVATLIGFGAVLAAISLAMHFGDALQMTQFLNAGPVGGLVLLILGLGYAPVAILWSVSYALGAGIAIGPGVVLSPFVMAPAPTNLPSFPLLAALPDQSSAIAWALPVLGIVAGIMIGFVIARRASLPALQRLGVAVSAVAIAAVALAILARLSSGSLGDVRLVALGPESESVALIGGILMLIGAVPAVLVAGRLPKVQCEASVDE